jgi:hypothetical protein
VRARKNPEHPIGHDGKSPVPLFEDNYTAEQWEEYLDRRRTGHKPDLAARAIGLTGTQMANFLNREPWRALAVAEAVPEGERHYQERLQATARVLALNTDEPNSRILEVELATHVPGYEHLRRDRVKHEGRIEHGVTIDLGKLDALPIEKRRALLSALTDLGEEIVEGDVVEIHELPVA